jgi:hypothetical protein
MSKLPNDCICLFYFQVGKVCKILCNDVYMSILQYDIFWWKLIDRKFFNPIFNTKVVLRAFPLFCSFHCTKKCHSKENIYRHQLTKFYKLSPSDF